MAAVPLGAQSDWGKPTPLLILRPATERGRRAMFKTVRKGRRQQTSAMEPVKDAGMS
jgi:hypothetical protein